MKEYLAKLAKINVLYHFTPGLQCSSPGRPVSSTVCDFLAQTHLGLTHLLIARFSGCLNRGTTKLSLDTVKQSVNSVLLSKIIISTKL